MLENNTLPMNSFFLFHPKFSMVVDTNHANFFFLFLESRHWPDFSNQEDMQYLGAEAFAFVNFARFAVPLRIGLALGTTPWIQENIVDRFLKKDDDDKESNVEPSVEEE